MCLQPKGISIVRSTRFWFPIWFVVLLILLEVGGKGCTTRRPTSDRACKTTNTFEFRPGVIVDPDRPAVYLMNPRHDIDAVDLSSGKLIWSTAQAAKPLLLYGDLLIAQGETPGQGDILSIVVLNTNEGENEFETSVELPDGVWASIDEGLGISFRASAHPHEGDVIVSWLFSQQYISGVPPGPDAPEPTQRTGVVRIDLETRGVDQLDPNAKPLPIEPQLPENIARLIESGALSGPLWRTGRVLATVVHTSAKDRKRITLNRWHCETGEPLPVVSLFRDELTFRYASADGRHLLASKRIESSRPIEYLWSIYSVETGESVAQIRHSSPAAWFFLYGSSLIHASPPTSRLVNGKWINEPPKLRAIALENGAELWDRPVRDTAYRGPYPPAIPGS